SDRDPLEPEQSPRALAGPLCALSPTLPGALFRARPTPAVYRLLALQLVHIDSAAGDHGRLATVGLCVLDGNGDFLRRPGGSVSRSREGETAGTVSSPDGSEGPRRPSAALQLSAD